jgi:hypothetical protein
LEALSFVEELVDGFAFFPSLAFEHLPLFELCLVI